MTDDPSIEPIVGESWWDWVWHDPRETYCSSITDMSEAEGDYLRSIRGMTPIWHAKDRPQEDILFRCPLSPGHGGRHVTAVGDIDYFLAEFIYDEEKDVGYSLTSWFLTWGPQSVDPRSILPLTGCNGRSVDPDGREWVCCLVDGHGGSCRFNVQVAAEDEDYEELGIDLSPGSFDEVAWIAERNEQVVAAYLAGHGTYEELGRSQGLSRSEVQQIVAESTSREQRAEALRQWRRNAYAHQRAALVLIATESERQAVERASASVLSG